MLYILGIHTSCIVMILLYTNANKPMSLHACLGAPLAKVVAAVKVKIYYFNVWYIQYSLGIMSICLPILLQCLQARPGYTGIHCTDKSTDDSNVMYVCMGRYYSHALYTCSN